MCNTEGFYRQSSARDKFSDLANMNLYMTSRSASLEGHPWEGIKQMLWAAFGEHLDSYKSNLISLDGGLESEKGVTDVIISILYQSFLPDLLQFGEIFMHDNASVHTARVVQAILEELEVKVMI